MRQSAEWTGSCHADEKAFFALRCAVRIPLFTIRCAPRGAPFENLSVQKMQGDFYRFLSQLLPYFSLSAYIGRLLFYEKKI